MTEVASPLIVEFGKSADSYFFAYGKHRHAQNVPAGLNALVSNKLRAMAIDFFVSVSIAPDDAFFAVYKDIDGELCWDSGGLDAYPELEAFISKYTVLGEPEQLICPIYVEFGSTQGSFFAVALSKKFATCSHALPADLDNPDDLLSLILGVGDDGKNASFFLMKGKEISHSNLPRGIKIWIRSLEGTESKNLMSLSSLSLPPHPDAAGRYFASIDGKKPSYTISCSPAALSVFEEIYEHWRSDYLEKRTPAAAKVEPKAQSEQQTKERERQEMEKALRRSREQMQALQTARLQQQLNVANNVAAANAAAAMARAARMRAVALNNAMVTQGSVFDPPGTTYYYRGGNPGNF
ncbi:hypothetical protein Dda_3376 [Drechslerella dactyloides]|uniref:Uncharacterized protein n=1 Tax=Drechslerella dactyloides TaxID=74499 RepID=A0AAD6J1G6_DREDA|nr:hypothetical protein Dda_3376 [Drechslerella dactyloides]